MQHDRSLLSSNKHLRKNEKTLVTTNGGGLNIVQAPTAGVDYRPLMVL